ncbi:hypothetical protein N9W89_07375 [Hellea sp.]|nr:hypothetical protein [Hellea sp.]
MELVQQIFSALLGLVMVGGLMAFMYKRDAGDWEKLHAVYGRDWTPPPDKRWLGNMLLYSEGRPAKAYNAGITIGVYPDGIGLRPLPWLVPFQKPIFIPISDIQGWQQKWYLNAKSVELAFRKIPEMRLIMPAKDVEWIMSKTQGRVSVSEDFPAHGNWPWFTYAYALFGLFMVGTVIFMMATNPDLKSYLENYKRH